jgi:transforming growth factor-beta-induced protein
MNILHRAALALAAATPLVLGTVNAHAADDIVATAEKAGSFKTLIAAVKAAGLVETLKGKGPLTVFAPTDDAFKKLPAGTLETLLKPESKDTLASILKFHVLPGAYSADRLTKAKARVYTVKTAAGVPVLFNKKGGLTIDGAKISKTDIGASNGTIHVIDSVILPPAVKKALAKSAAAAPAAKAVEPAKSAAPAQQAPQPATKADAPKADGSKAAIPAVPAAPKK